MQVRRRRMRLVDVIATVLLLVSSSHAGEVDEFSLGEINQSLRDITESVDAIRDSLPRIGDSAVATYSSGDEPYSIFVMSVDGSGLRQLCGIPAADGQGSPAWSADGKSIAFDAWSSQTSGAQVYTVGVDGTNLKSLGTGAMPIWDESGERVLFHRYDDWGLWRMAGDGTEKTKLMARAMTPQLRPNTKEVAITAFGQMLCLSKPPYHKATPVPGEYKVDFGFGWSPDGQQICGRRPSESEREKSLVVINIADADEPPKVVFKGDMGVHVKWSPDGKWLLFSVALVDNHHQLYVVSPDGGEPRLLKGQDPRRSNTDGSWSPDGRHIAFASRPIARPDASE